TQLIHQIQAVLPLSQVQHNSTSFSCDLFERSVKLESRVVNQGTKHIARKIFGVNPYENGFIGGDIAHYHCQMYITVDDVFVRNRTKSSVNGGKGTLNNSTNQLLFTDSISDEVGDTDHFEIMFGSKLFKLSQPGHRT